jgi:glycosyltransferase involved in cell wall biosynthesis
VSDPIRVLELRSVRGTGGGPEKTILLGAARADRSRVAVTVCYIRDARDDIFAIDERARALGVEYVEITETSSFDPRIWKPLRALIRTHRIDIVHSHEYKTDLLALALAWRTGVKPLATAHGWTGGSSREQRLYYPADKYLLARFPRVIAVSNQVREELVSYGVRPDRVSVILNGIDAERFRRDPGRIQSARAALHLSPSDLAIAAVGRLEVQKRFDLLLQAVAEVARSRPAVRLLVAGDGSERARLEADARALGLEVRVQFLGHVTDLRDLHHAATLFVQSADYEGTPNAVLEAMAFETPVVATDAGGTRELVRDGVDGTIVPTGDAGRLAAAIGQALDDPEAARLKARQARARVETELTFEARMRRVEAIYAELAEKGL